MEYPVGGLGSSDGSVAGCRRTPTSSQQHSCVAWNCPLTSQGVRAHGETASRAGRLAWSRVWPPTSRPPVRVTAHRRLMLA